LLKNQIQKYWTYVIGNEDHFSLECRIFNAVTIFAVFTASINAIINICLGLVIYGIIMVPLIGILFLCYYLARHKQKLNLAVIICALSFNLLCGITYFESAASNGVNLFTFILIIFILTIVTSKKQFWIWIPLNIAFLAALLIAEYHYPELVEPLYTDKEHKLLDLSQTIFEIIFMMIVITIFMKNSYNKEKKLAERRLIELEEINDTKNKLFSIVAHDLRAPLASVENYLSLLNDIDLEPNEKKTIEQNLLVSTKQTSEMLQNILHWSKDQMQGIAANLNDVPLYQILEHTIRLQQTLAKEKHIELKFEIPSHLIVIADTDMLQLIIRNLLNNAIKFSLPNGQIDINATQNKKNCIITIADNGIGISDEESLNIFSLKNKGTFGTQQEKGVGLGLLLAKTYIELQNGKIWFERNLKGGTTFFISIPLAHPQLQIES